MKNLLTIMLMILALNSAWAQQKSTIENPEIMSVQENEPLVCLLTDEELIERKNAFQKEVFAKIKGVEELDTGYMLRLTDSKELLENLFHYVAAERQCCPFFKQEITVGPENSDVLWKITGRKGVKEMLTVLFADLGLKTK